MFNIRGIRTDIGTVLINRRADPPDLPARESVFVMSMRAADDQQTEEQAREKSRARQQQDSFSSHAALDHLWKGWFPPAMRFDNGLVSRVERPASLLYSTTTGILPILACHSRGPVLWTDSPVESTATVTGMSSTVNS